MIKSYINMEFEMKSCFMPNISNSESLKVLDVTDCSVVIQMNNPDCRGVFPSDTFQYWIRKGSLIPINENEKKTS
ncbi:hypothetical protein KHA94_22800 [Bacillus sp. FJAT-49705]|uniref:Uncharacterized protein n=1 Tax=Cytobacillus citreus TaxID=2833586 RepID=A0ABS5P0J4_9BACI|nr:hypothetical protein [Cytobacillus citreus]MBS4192948.1 hypothetical protein [Cytobacillus citreus]